MSSTRRILFVGNSLTYRGGGLDLHYRSVVEDCETERVVKGGATLKRMLPLAEEAIRGGGWDVVVLQDDLPETTIEEFLQSVREGGALVREGGARPVLLMTWPYERLGWIDTIGIADAHRQAAAENCLDIVPAGLAWEASRMARPELELLDKDREHPSVAGSWLAACTLASTLGTLLEETNLAGKPPELSDEEMLFLTGIARDTVRKSG